MNLPEKDQKQDAETLEQLLDVVNENRNRRCAEVSESTRLNAREILQQAHTRVRARLRRHVSMLREKYRVSISAAQARKETLIRQQQQKADKACLDKAWPVLREALLALWRDPESRQTWIEAAIDSAASNLLEADWRLEYPLDFTAQDAELMQQTLGDRLEKTAELTASGEIEAGIRIISHGTVVDATIDGLLQQKQRIEATLISGIKQNGFSHE